MPPRSRPFGDLFASGRSPQLQRTASGNPPLTPRTPHTRSGRAEEGLTEVELSDLRHDSDDDDDSSGHQSQPLLSRTPFSSLAASTGYRSRGDDRDIRESGYKYVLSLVVERSPLVVGTLLLCFGLAITMLSFKKASTEIDVVQAAQPSPSRLYSQDALRPTPSAAAARFISYENYTKFPLSGPEFHHECEKLMGGFMHHSGYWVPPRMGPLDVPHHDDDVSNGGRGRVCRASITYMLDGQVGLAADLALMAQVAGIARQRNRTFLVDDTYWNRGKWTNHFEEVRKLQPGPEPGCRAPPPEELVACPRTARHWVVNSRTAKYHLGHPYSEEYEDPYSLGINRVKPIFERGLHSFLETIRPNAQNMALIQAARSEIASILDLHPVSNTSMESDNHPEKLRAHSDPYIAVHIRRGDRKAESWAFHKSYVPLEHYVTAARDAWSRLYPDIPLESPPLHFPAPPITYIASDSTDMLRDYVAAFSPSTAMFALALSTNSGLRALAPHHAYVQTEFVKEEEAERILLTRGMIVDLALLSGLWASEGDAVPGAVVCTISSNVCKISALGLGWERAFGFDDGGDYSMGAINEQRKRWVEIDNKDAVSPEWRAFDLF
ncbi:hypothetical protein BKA93DRAFT_357908 [Sparassis latifolia]